jgi:hypothetical protein
MNNAASPQTLEAAISILVDQDVAKWGEAEREASRAHHANRTYGLALNELANRAFMADSPGAADLAKAAKKALTRSDRAVLRAAR